MKTRKLIKGMMAVAIVAVAGLAIYANQPKEEMSDVMLANIEALATGESIGQCRWKRVFDSNGCQYWYASLMAMAIHVPVEALKDKNIF